MAKKKTAPEAPKRRAKPESHPATPAASKRSGVKKARGKSAAPPVGKTKGTTEAPPARKAKNPVLAAPDDCFVRVRMYRHGLGDCFLVSFRRPGEKKGDPSFHILIDCGIIPGNPNATVRIEQVVNDIKATTGGKIDILVATHEHADHVSGFNQAKDLFGEKGAQGAFAFDQVWLAWTENPKDSVGNSIRAERRQKVAALWMGVQAMRQRLTALGADAEASADFQRAAEVLSFFGIDAKDAPPMSGGLGAAADALGGGPIAQAMKWVQARGAKDAKFWSPGNVFNLDGVDETRVFVLGPPKDLKQLHKALPSASQTKTKETYDDKADDANDAQAFGLGMTGASRGFLTSAFGAVAMDPGSPVDLGTDRALPFDQKYQILWEKAKQIEFFQDHYFGSEDSQTAQAWRRIDGEWAAGSAAFAMQLDGDTNNTSLALAFELPGGHVLLFPGDAQVGNWESWHADSKGVARDFHDEAGNPVKVTTEGLLNRVVFYKVGHHGSHNATLRDQGLEMMTRPGLTAAIPVDAYVAHVKKRWKKMPFNPLMDRLAALTKDNGLVVKVDTEVPGKSKTVVSEDVSVTVVDSDKLFDDDFDVENQDTKVKRPLYVDFRIKLG
jgi:hypothetical protein